MGFFQANSSSSSSNHNNNNNQNKKKKMTKQEEHIVKFFVACQEGNIDKVKKYIHLKRIPDIHTVVDEMGRTPLHMVAEYGHLHIVQYFIYELHININSCITDTGATPLYYAVRRNQLHIVQSLLGIKGNHSNIYINNKGNNNNNNNNNNKTTNTTTVIHANVKAMDIHHHTALHYASYFGYIEIVDCLLSIWPENILARGIEGHTPFHTAAETGQLDVIQYFMEHLCNDVNVVDPNVITKDGYTPLHFACQNGHLHCVKYLLSFMNIKMNIKTIDQHQYTPYDLAMKGNKMDIIEYFNHRYEYIHIYFCSIENGNYNSFLKCITGNNTSNSNSSIRNIHSKDSSNTSNTSNNNNNNVIPVATTFNEYGNMALHVAALHYHNTTSTTVSNHQVDGTNISTTSTNNNNNNNGYINIIQYIIQDLKIDIHTRNENGWTALHLACSKGHLPLIRYMIEVLLLLQDNNDDILHTITTNDTNGETLLHIASRYGQLHMVQYLITKCHMDMNIKNLHQQTSYELACIANQDMIIEYYVQRQDIEDQLFVAAQQGDLDRMKQCMKEDDDDNDIYGVNVKTVNMNQSTVLHFACRYGHLHIVQYLMQHYGDDPNMMNINARNKDGCTPLHFASYSGHLPIVQYLIEEEGCYMYMNDMTNDGETAYDLALNTGNINVADYLSNITKHHSTKMMIPGLTKNASPSMTLRSSLQQHQSPARPSLRKFTTIPGVTNNNKNDNDDDIISPLDPEVLADRNRLDGVINDPTADPIIIGLKYLDFCTNQFTSKLLGEGAFGKVYLGYDHDLNNIQFAIKRIRFDALDENKINQIALSFRREISVLKRFRHPNIVILYGYNVQLQQSNQFLVYEYLSNGSLNTFLMDEKGRTRLPSEIRLSIMFQITRSIHFLHTGGCDNLVIYHRDIKSGNICLTKDYTAKLIDCGLAKFVPDNQNAMTPGSVSPTILNDSGAVTFGTPGYVCPIYSRGHVTFSAACDVFSLGVVFAELIVGCLQGGRSSRGSQNFGDYFSRYIRDDDDDIVENGWQILMREADCAAEWNDEILELLCKLTVKCMAASPKRRYSTSDLVEELSKLSFMNFGSMPDIENETDITQVEELGRTMSLESKSDVHCVLCNRLTCKTVKCTDGHHTCVQCVEQEIQMQVGRSGDGVICKCGIGFHDTALYGKISSSIYHFYVQERVTQIVLDRNFSDIKKKLDTITTMTETNHDSVMKRLKSIDSKIQRVLGGLAYMATNSVQECPTLLWLVPADRTAGNSAKSWKQWTNDFGQRRYDLYFICQHSFDVVDKKVGITVTRSWLVQAAPVLSLSLFFLRIALTIGGLPPLPFPIQKLARATQIAVNEDYVEDLLDDASATSIEAFKAAYTQRTDLPYSESAKLLTSMSASYEGVVKKATSLRKCVWKQAMEPVVNHLGCIIWIKKEYRGLYVD